jgi:hypothetical protein
MGVPHHCHAAKKPSKLAATSVATGKKRVEKKEKKVKMRRWLAKQRRRRRRRGVSALIHMRRWQ